MNCVNGREDIINCLELALIIIQITVICFKSTYIKHNKLQQVRCKLIKRITLFILGWLPFKLFASRNCVYKKMNNKKINTEFSFFN